MPKANAQQVQPRVKEALLDSASQLIAEVGWGKVSSRMVATRAGVNNALVHYHFDSMDDLLSRAAVRSMEQAFARPTRELWRRGDLIEGLRAAVRWLGSVDPDSPAVGILIESLAEARRNAGLRERAAGELEALRKEFAGALQAADGRVRSDEARGVATLVLALLDGLLLHRAVDPDLDLRPAGRVVGTVVTMPPT